MGFLLFQEIQGNECYGHANDGKEDIAVNGVMQPAGKWFGVAVWVIFFGMVAHDF